MFQIADWSRRKLEIADAFREAAPLPAEAEPEAYEALLTQIGVSKQPGHKHSHLLHERHHHGREAG